MTTDPSFAPDGWFREVSTMWPGQAMGLKVKKVLLDAPSTFQRVGVFENDGPWGKVLTLDGAIQLTDRDEFVYHEMMAHVPLCCHPRPQHVLIVGGGDGGVMREVLKHTCVERCDLVDIDGMVIDVAKENFPNVAVSFGDPRANVVVGDGAAFVKDKTDCYDVIIVDSSDPEGPASVLFGEEFYLNVKRALRKGGLVCSQGESIWLHLDMIARLRAFLLHRVGFGRVQYGMIYIPTYPCGSIGALLSMKDALDEGTAAADAPVRALPDEVQAKLKYYTPLLHRASFVLPKFAAEALSS